MKVFLQQTIREAGHIGLSFFGKNPSFKIKSNPNDIVTEADEAVSDFLVGKIHETYPSHHIMSEELATDINKGADIEWVIDPIDGTWPFSKGIPTWAIMISVLEKGETILAAVYFPVQDDLFFAEKGKGAFRNDKQIHVSNADSLNNTTCIIHRSASVGPYGVLLERFRHMFTRFVLETEVALMNVGSAASLCYVAAGAIDFATGNAGLDWDRLPVNLICEEAGAIVTDSDGNEWVRGRQDYVIANSDLHPKVMEMFLPSRNT
jgi:myo-inositol-1(or 4)-monophosphatase